VLVFIFSLATPAGILLGIILTGISEILEAIFLSISAGTFLYISASEVVTEEFSLDHNKIQKFIGFLIGAAMILFLTIFEFMHR
jgi:zinc transporter ZupT